MAGKALLLAVVSLAVASCEIEQTRACGNGVIDTAEQCDDGNRQSGDGCSAACELEYAAPSCVPLITTPDALQHSLLVTADGRVLVTGEIETTESGRHGWVGAFDTDGAQLWSLELDGHSSVAYSIRARGQGFVFVHGHDFEDELVTVDGRGQITETTALSALGPDVGHPIDLLDTDDGLLIAGTIARDAWLARLDAHGQLTTLVVEDHAGFDDRIVALALPRDARALAGEGVALAREGAVVAALAQVGVADHSSGDSIELETQDTLLIEYDESGNELSKTVLSSGDDRVSLSGVDLDQAEDGTWIIAGTRHAISSLDHGSLGWGAAVRDGELLWSFESRGSVDRDGQPFANFFAAAAGGSVMLAGRVASSEGVRRWATRLELETGAVLTELVGRPADGPEVFVDGNSTPEGKAWLLGHTRHPDRVEQWLCSTQL